MGFDAARCLAELAVGGKSEPEVRSFPHEAALTAAAAPARELALGHQLAARLGPRHDDCHFLNSTPRIPEPEDNPTPTRRDIGGIATPRGNRSPQHLEPNELRSPSVHPGLALMHR